MMERNLVIGIIVVCIVIAIGIGIYIYWKSTTKMAPIHFPHLERPHTEPLGELHAEPVYDQYVNDEAGEVEEEQQPEQSMSRPREVLNREEHSLMLGRVNHKPYFTKNKTLSIELDKPASSLQILFYGRLEQMQVHIYNFRGELMLHIVRDDTSVLVNGMLRNNVFAKNPKILGNIELKNQQLYINHMYISDYMFEPIGFFTVTSDDRHTKNIVIAEMVPY